MYDVKIIITNQNSIKNTTAEIFFRYAKFCNTFEFCNTFCNTLEFCDTFAIFSYAILFTILAKFCNTFYIT